MSSGWSARLVCIACLLVGLAVSFEHFATVPLEHCIYVMHARVHVVVVNSGRLLTVALI